MNNIDDIIQFFDGMERELNTKINEGKEPHLTPLGIARIARALAMLGRIVKNGDVSRPVEKTPPIKKQSGRLLS